MVVVHAALPAAAFVCFALGAAGVGSRVNLVAVGLALWVLTEIIPGHA